MNTTNHSDASSRKSSYRNSESNCVEVAFRAGSVAVRDSKDSDGPALAFRAGSVAVRDSKDSDGPALAFRPGAWTAFLRRLRNAR